MNYTTDMAIRDAIVHLRRVEDSLTEAGKDRALNENEQALITQVCGWLRSAGSLLDDCLDRSDDEQAND